MREKLVEGCWEPDGLGPVTAELSDLCYGCHSSLLYIALSVYSQIVTGVHTQFTDD